jgi:hypothetical protein
MLDAGAHTLTLHAADKAGGQLSREVRVLGKIFKIPAAQRTALVVDAGAEQDAHLFPEALLPQGGAISSISSGSNEQALAEAVGKQVAGTLSLRPMWSAFPACFLSPWGPSVIIISGRPNRAFPSMCQKSFPCSSAVFLLQSHFLQRSCRARVAIPPSGPITVPPPVFFSSHHTLDGENMQQKVAQDAHTSLDRSGGIRYNELNCQNTIRAGVKPMHTEFLMGNEAIAMGALAAGVSLVCGYPGTPSTEVLETVAKNRPEGVEVEWSVNAKMRHGDRRRRGHMPGRGSWSP